MSIPSRLSILKSKTGLHSFTNITLVRPMAKILLDGAQMILLMPHGGTSLLKVRTRISLVVFKFQTPLEFTLAMQADSSLVTVSFPLVQNCQTADFWWAL